jgi:hypothetical protein
MNHFRCKQFNRANDGLQDISPRDVPRRVAVSIVAVPASKAAERTLICSVALFAATTLRAFTRRVRRIHGRKRDTLLHAFIRHELSELMERPALMLCSLTALDLNSITDTRKILEFDTATCALGGPYNVMADLVVYVPAEPCLFVRKAFQMALGGFGAARLQRSSELGNADSSVFDIRPAVRVAVRVGSEGNNPQVHTQEPLWIGHGGIVKFAPDMDVPRRTLAFDELTTLNARGGSEQMALIVADVHGRFDTSVHSAQAEDFTFNVNRHDALVVVNAGRLETTCQLTLAFPNSRQCANGEVRTESVAFTNHGVKPFLQFKLIPDIRRSRSLQHMIASIRKLVHGLEKALGFTRTGLKFATHAQEAHIAYKGITQLFSRKSSFGTLRFLRTVCAFGELLSSSV